MKSLNFTTVGISILIVLNISMAVVLFTGHFKRNKFNHVKAKTMAMHSKRSAHTGPARHKEHPARFRKNECLKVANLTDEQKEKIKDLNGTHRNEIKKIRTQMKDLRKKEQEFVQGDNVNENQLALLSDEFAQYQKDIYKLRLNNRQAIQNTLTAEQKDALAGSSCRSIFDRKGSSGSRFSAKHNKNG